MPPQAATDLVPSLHQAITRLVLSHSARKPLVGCNKHVCLAWSYCLVIPCLNEIQRGHDYVNDAFIFFSFPLSLALSESLCLSLLLFFKWHCISERFSVTPQAFSDRNLRHHYIPQREAE